MISNICPVYNNKRTKIDIFCERSFLLFFVLQIINVIQLISQPNIRYLCTHIA